MFSLKYRKYKPDKETSRLIDYATGYLRNLEVYPLTIRNLFYHLSGNGLIPNTYKSYKKTIRWLTRAREAEMIPDSVFEDTTRIVRIKDDTYYKADDIFATNTLSLYEEFIDYKYSTWINQPIQIVIVIEKTALRRRFQHICNEFGVSVIATNGFDSRANQLQFVKQMNEISKNKKTIVLVFTDFDASGIEIFHYIQRTCRNKDLVKRIGLTHEQKTKYNLPSVVLSEEDKRKKMKSNHGKGFDYNIEEWSELDALSIEQIREILTEEINKYFEKEIYEEIKDELDSEELKLKELAESLPKNED